MSTRRRSTRRTVLRTLGSLGLALASIATGATASDDGDGDSNRDGDGDGTTDALSRSAADDCEPSPVQQYVATVDRIVDGRHVVLLLEDDGELVDQHVAPRSRLEAVDEGDILFVVIRDGDLLVAAPLPKRLGRSATEPSPQERFNELASDDPA